MNLTETPYGKVKSGAKIIESRLLDEKRQSISIGDIIEFQLNSEVAESVTAKVVALLQYPSFESLMSDFTPAKFGGESKDELLSEIHQFYSPEEENKHGVLGIKIELILKELTSYLEVK